MLHYIIEFGNPQTSSCDLRLNIERPRSLESITVTSSHVYRENTLSRQSGTNKIQALKSRALTLSNSKHLSSFGESKCSFWFILCQHYSMKGKNSIWNTPNGTAGSQFICYTFNIFRNQMFSRLLRDISKTFRQRKSPMFLQCMWAIWSKHNTIFIKPRSQYHYFSLSYTEDCCYLKPFLLHIHCTVHPIQWSSLYLILFIWTQALSQ